LQTTIKQLEAADVQIVAISYDSVDVLSQFAKKRKITYPLLSDEKSTVIRAFGVLNDDATGKQSGIPHPGTFVVGQDGRVHTNLLGTVRHRHTAGDLLKAVQTYEKNRTRK
jgi:peroxiredoxin